MDFGLKSNQLGSHKKPPQATERENDNTITSLTEMETTL